MAELRIRPMTQDGFTLYRGRVVREYAAEHARVGDWSQEEAEARAAKETDDLLPDGADTAGTVLLVAEADGQAVGLVWVGTAPSPRTGWWIYDISVVPAHRRRGYGRALLEAAERKAQERGADSLGLNVFGGNDAARRLYESLGCDVAATFMRKRLTL